MAKRNSYSKLVTISKNDRKNYNNVTREHLVNDLAPTYPYGGKFLKVGDMELLLTKSGRTDKVGNSIYIGTLLKRSGLLKNKVSSASHIAVKKF